MKKTIILFSILFLVLGMSLISITYGWFVSSKRTGNISFESGKVQYILYGNLSDTEKIIPGQELVENSIGISNYSSVSTQLRIKIAYRFEDGEVEDFTSNNSVISSNTASVIGTVNNSFIYNDDGYWYYYYSQDDQVIPKDLNNVLQIDILTNLNCNGNVCGTSIKEKKIGVLITFEARQEKNMSWEDIAWETLSTITFEN